MNRKDDVLLRDFLLAQLLQNQLRREDALPVRVLMDRGQPGNSQLGKVVIVKSDDGLLCGHGDPAFAEARHDAGGQDIRGSENSGDFLSGGKQPAQLLAFLHSDFLREDQGGIIGNIVFVQSPAITLKALLNDAAGTDGRRGKGDGAMAFLQQVPGCDIAALFILQADTAGIRIVPFTTWTTM